MSKPEERKRARELRQEGWAIHEIAKELKIRKETVSKWLRDIELTEDMKAKMKERNPHWESQQKGAQVNKEKAYELRINYQEAGRNKAQEGSFLHLIGSMLYWAEGAKDRTALRFINTDANMLKLFMRFLREEMNVEDEFIGLQVLHHTTDENEITRIRKYWLECLELPSSTRVSMYVKVGTTSRKKRYDNGICAIEVGSVKVLQHIYGAIQEYIGFEQPKWGA
jgi:transcriptional regulator with XRE-family HTH domain